MKPETALSPIYRERAEQKRVRRRERNRRLVWRCGYVYTSQEMQP